MIFLQSPVFPAIPLIIYTDFDSQSVIVSNRSNDDELSSYDMNTFMAGQVDITEISADQNQSIRAYIVLVRQKISASRDMYQIQASNVIGYSDRQNDLVREGFNRALNLIYKKIESQAKRDAYEYIKENFKGIGSPE